MTTQTRTVLADDDRIATIMASPAAAMTGIMPHPSKPHTYILMLADENLKTLAHRELDAAQVVRHAHQVLCIIDHMSVDTLSEMLSLNAMEGTKN